ncbi:DUF3565 domain-containing protein [Thiohalophilus sp.]|uniref:DUF3565 domain-containing protein n=1 Tax=Thiohalophilus sp. TaxID=3028392 RepID=UPI003975EB1A
MTESLVSISGFVQDEEGDWIAELSCGHRRHVRHRPPWQNRPWVVSETGRQSMIGYVIPCRDCQKNIRNS